MVEQEQELKMDDLPPEVLRERTTFGKAWNLAAGRRWFSVEVHSGGEATITYRDEPRGPLLSPEVKAIRDTVRPTRGKVMMNHEEDF